MLLHECQDLARDLVGGTPGPDEPHALGLGTTDLEISAADAPMQGELLALEVIEPTAADPPEAFLRRQVEEQREVGRKPAGGVDIQLADEVEVDPAPVPLVGDGGVGVAVAEHHAPTREPGRELLGDVLMPRGHEEEDLRERFRTNAATLEQPPDGHAERRAVGLPRALDAMARAAQRALET